MGERQPNYYEIIDSILVWYDAVEGVRPPTSQELDLNPHDSYYYSAILETRKRINKES